MSEKINIVCNNVSPSCCWSTIRITPNKDTVTAVKFDRKYKYFWVWDEYEDACYGLAVDSDSVNRAVAVDAQGNFKNFNIYSDGIMPVVSGTGIHSRCVAVGPRDTLYVLPSAFEDGSVMGAGTAIYISAQDDPVCPFADHR